MGHIISQQWMPSLMGTLQTAFCDLSLAWTVRPVCEIWRFELELALSKCMYPKIECRSGSQWALRLSELLKILVAVSVWLVIWNGLMTAAFLSSAGPVSSWTSPLPESEVACEESYPLLSSAGGIF